MKHKIDSKYLCDVFVKYAKVESNSAEGATKTPSTEGQFTLGRIIVEDFKKLGVTDVVQDEHAYVVARVKGNTKAPAISFIAHLDTYPETNGKNVQPIVHSNYDGNDIKLPKESASIKISEQPELKDKKGKTIITASGDTLLGGDDKCGIAICMETCKFLMENSSFKHGDVVFIFTPDEEIGHGADLLDIKKLNVACGYTLDGEGVGSITNETFCADQLTVTITGREFHPGHSKDKMVSAIRLVAKFLEKLPMDARPETTEKRQGFLHPTKIEGGVTTSKITFLVRDFTVDGLKKFENIAKKIADDLLKEFPVADIKFEIKEQYRNMVYELEKDPRVVAYAAKASEECGIKPEFSQARGGTDGSRLSYRGLLAPDMPCGMYAYHSKNEWACLEDMAQDADIVKQIISIWAKEPLK